MENQYSLTWLSQLQGQAGVISRQQASEVGVTTKAIEWKLRSGAWQRLQPGVYATFTGEPPREAKLWAAVLRAGPGAALSHESAAEVHGLIDKPATRIHVSVPTERRPGQQGKIRGVVIHRWRDIHRDNVNLVQGIQTLRYGWPDTTQNRCLTAAQIAAVLRRHGWPGTPRPCGPACHAA